MTIHRIRLLGDPVLRAKCEPITKPRSTAVRVIMDDMRETLRDWQSRFGGGRAIAAPQIGAPVRMVYVEMDQPWTLINPEIVDIGNEDFEVWDDCFSFPNLLVRVSRAYRFSIEDWRATITGELDIPFFVSKFAWPHLVQRGGGVIINVASDAGMIAAETPPIVGHAAAKAGVIAMTRQLALEGARYGIRAVAISPGPFLTPAADRDLGDDQAARDAITKKTLLKRFGQPEEVAELAAFIASDRASYITGANYPVDGGATAW